MLRLMACDVFKIVNKLLPEYIQDMFSNKTSTYNFRGERKANIPRVNTTRYGLNLFRSEALWIRIVFLTTCKWHSHTRSSEGCYGDGMALDVDALCVVPSFVFAFCLCVTPLCFVCCFCFS